MKRLICLLSALVICLSMAFGLSACSDEGKIIGVWEAEYVAIDFDGDENIQTVYLWFFDDGDLFVSYDKDFEEFTYFTYKIQDGNLLIFNGGSDDGFMLEAEVTRKTFTIETGADSFLRCKQDELEFTKIK